MKLSRLIRQLKLQASIARGARIGTDTIPDQLALRTVRRLTRRR